MTLARGERMVVPIAEFKLAYRDVYTLEIPLLPPPEVRRSFNSSRRRELAKLMNAPKAIHKIRLVNKSPYPLTTAPALILKSGRLLAQSMMTYTAIGATTDLEITTAVNLHVAHVERETGRKPQALKWFRNGSSWQWLTRIDMAGVIQLANHSGKPVELEVKRRVLGNVEKASNEGAATRADTLGGRAYVRPADYPHWWNWYSWPRWWHQHNGFDTISWTVKIDPKKRLELKYNWHYFWG